jgi:GNAT superfamily N-acetyltransferase
MTRAQDFSPQDVRLMQNLAQRVSALRPELVNSDATVGELAWVWGKDHLDHGDTWRRRLWFDGSDLAGWGWIYLPYQVMRSDGQLLDVTTTRLIWQVHPYRPQILDEILDWYPTQASPADLRVTVADADADAQHRLAAHGYRLDEQASGDHGSWTQFNRRDLGELPEPMLPPGFRLLTADQVSPEAAAQAHRDAWHPSSFTDRAMREVSRIWPYRPDLHVLVQAPDGTMAATTIMWLDEHNGTAEFEPVGTHQGYRRQGLARALLHYGMQQARKAGAVQTLVACLGAPAHQAARALYYDVGFRPFTREVLYVKPAAPAELRSRMSLHSMTGWATGLAPGPRRAVLPVEPGRRRDRLPASHRPGPAAWTATFGTLRREPTSACSCWPGSAKPGSLECRNARRSPRACSEPAG